MLYPVLVESVLPTTHDVLVNKMVPGVLKAAPMVKDGFMKSAEWLLSPGQNYGAQAAKVGDGEMVKSCESPRNKYPGP